MEVLTPDATTEGYHDACGKGMGGVFCSHNGPPTVWRSAFPTDIKNRLVTFKTLKVICR